MRAKNTENVFLQIAAGRVLRGVCLCVFAWLIFGLGGARGERLPIRIYTSADGLGSSFVNSLARDSRGFLWFATRDGLSRFDGYEFTTYQIGEKDAPPGIEQLYETRAGIYWITTTGGLYRFDPNAGADAFSADDRDKRILRASRQPAARRAL